MAKYKIKETKEGIIQVLENKIIIAQYQIDRHWQEKNISEKEDYLSIRLYNRMKGYLDCKVYLNKKEVQYIPNK